MKVGLFGFGRAGRATASVLLSSKDCTLQWIVRKTKTLDHRSASDFLGIESEDPAYIYTKDEFDDVIADKKNAVDVIIDFSNEKSIYEYGPYAAKNGIAIVTAISKYQEEEKAYLKKLSKKTRVLWSPNITIGINFLMMAAQVLKKIAPQCDIEIIEEHFKTKSEVSGTAKVLAKKLNVDDKSIKAIRAGGIVGKHEILFGFPYQVVRLTHESISREAFGNGALFAARSVLSLKNGLYTMEDLFKPYFQL